MMLIKLIIDRNIISAVDTRVEPTYNTHTVYGLQYLRPYDHASGATSGADQGSSGIFVLFWYKIFSTFNVTLNAALFVLVFRLPEDLRCGFTKHGKALGCYLTTFQRS